MAVLAWRVWFLFFFYKSQDYISKAVANLSIVDMVYKSHYRAYEAITDYDSKVDRLQPHRELGDLKEMLDMLGKTTKEHADLILQIERLPSADEQNAGTSGRWTSGAGTQALDFRRWYFRRWYSGAGTSGAGTSGAGTSGAGQGFRRYFRGLLQALVTSGAGTSGAGTSGAGNSGAGTSGAGTSGAGNLTCSQMLTGAGATSGGATE